MCIALGYSVYYGYYGREFRTPGEKFGRIIFCRKKTPNLSRRGGKTFSCVCRQRLCLQADIHGTPTVKVGKRVSKKFFLIFLFIFESNNGSTKRTFKLRQSGRRKKELVDLTLQQIQVGYGLLDIEGGDVLIISQQK